MRKRKVSEEKQLTKNPSVQKQRKTYFLDYLKTARFQKHVKMHQNRHKKTSGSQTSYQNDNLKK